MKSTSILGSRIANTSYSEVLKFVEKSIDNGKKINKYICCCNVHVVIEAYKSSKYLEAINNSSINTPDGVPLTWVQNINTRPKVSRVYGPDLMLRLCDLASEKNYSIGFYGSTDKTLIKLKSKILDRNCGMKIPVIIAPPYRELTEIENEKFVSEINRKNVDILFVGLGAPKQELWMFHNKDKVNSVMLGVGAAFDFLSGNKVQAPFVFQKYGLEWLFRLVTEPRRLFIRYLTTNSLFIFLIVKQLIKLKD